MGGPSNPQPSGPEKLKARLLDLIHVAGFIRPDDLKRERDLSETKWFDYAFLSPLEATKLFAKHYVDAYRAAWARNFDLKESRHRRGLFNAHLILDSSAGTKERRTLTSLWKCRQFADQLGVPYDFFCRTAFQFWLDSGPKRMPQPNQLYSHPWRGRVAEAIRTAWQEQQVNATIYPVLAQFQVAAMKGARAQRRQIEWCLEILKLKHGHPWNIAHLVRGRGLLPEAEALRLYGEERIERARGETVTSELVDVSHLAAYDFLPACAFVPHAYDAGAAECAGCHVREQCGAAQASILKRIIAKHGSDDPMQRRKREQTALRVRACRQRAAEKAMVTVRPSSCAPSGM